VKLQQAIQNPSLAAIDIEAIRPEPIAAVSPQALVFGNQQLGVAGAAQTLTLSNSGNAPLLLASVGVSGANPADFSVQNGCGASLAAGAQCALQVSFLPTAVGARAASLVLQTNVGAQAIALSGTGFGTPQAVLSLTSLNFGNVGLGVASPAQTVTLSNTQGTAALTLTSVTVGGASPGDYVVLNSCGSSIAAGASCSLSLQFKPTTLGPRPATLVINDNASATAQVVVLSGSGGSNSQLLEIVSKSSGKALDVTGASLNNGTPIIQWDYWGGDNQKWYLVDLGNGYYKIQNKLSGKVLDMTDFSLSDGGLLQQWEYWGGDNQQWQIVLAEPGYYKIINKLSGKVLDVPAFTADNGAPIEQWDDNSGNNQKWVLSPAN
jgi:ricin-type beta-trefoil lectin protein/centrosomal CEP192-like protein/HYDIN/CFA65/VesB family protein